jgi:hypothetical protein
LRVDIDFGRKRNVSGGMLTHSASHIAIIPTDSTESQDDGREEVPKVAREEARFFKHSGVGQEKETELSDGVSLNILARTGFEKWQSA